METETKPQGSLEEESTPVSTKSTKGHKQNGEAEHPLHNGDSLKNGVEEPRVPELRRSTRSTPSKKKEEVEQTKEKPEEVEEAELEEDPSESTETPEDFKIYRKSFIRVNESRKDQETMTPPTPSDITLSGRVSGRRSFREQLNRKRKAEVVEEPETTPTKKASLNESWVKSPGWRYLATPFSKFFSSTPRPAPSSDSMIVQYDEKTICREDISMAGVETEEKPPSKWGCSLM